MNRLLRHPSSRELGRWLSGDEGGAEIDAHLAVCDRCAARLQAMDDTPELEISEQLTTLLAPPPDLTDRLERRVAAKLDTRRVLGVMADLFGVGFETGKLLLSEGPEVDES